MLVVSFPEDLLYTQHMFKILDPIIYNFVLCSFNSIRIFSLKREISQTKTNAAWSHLCVESKYNKTNLNSDTDNRLVVAREGWVMWAKAWRWLKKKKTECWKIHQLCQKIQIYISKKMNAVKSIQWGKTGFPTNDTGTIGIHIQKREAGPLPCMTHRN